VSAKCGASRRHMAWSQPKPCTNTMGVPLPWTLTLLRWRTDMGSGLLGLLHAAGEGLQPGAQFAELALGDHAAGAEAQAALAHGRRHEIAEHEHLARGFL